MILVGEKKDKITKAEMYSEREGGSLTPVAQSIAQHSTAPAPAPAQQRGQGQHTRTKSDVTAAATAHNNGANSYSLLLRHQERVHVLETFELGLVDFRDHGAVGAER